MTRGMIVMFALACRIASADPDEDGPRSPSTALALSAGGTAASLAVMTMGLAEHQSGERLAVGGFLSLALTPSLGEWYSGKFFTPGLGLRLGAPVGALVVGLVANAVLPCRSQDGGEFCEPNPAVVGAAFLAGAGLFATGVGYDIITAPRQARRYNREHAQMSIVPSGPAGTYGLSLAGTF